MTDFVHIRREPPLRFVTLDTGPRNVLGLPAVRALQVALAPDPEAPVVVLAGRDDAFCAGLDGGVLAQGGLQQEALLGAMGELLVGVLRGPTRLVVECRGHAVAAGAMLLLVADLRLGAPGRYKVGFTEPRLGMPLPELPVLLARERLSRRRLHELTVLGRILEPEEAATAGFLDRVVSGGSLSGEASARALELAELSAPAYEGTLRAVWGDAIERLQALVDAQAARVRALG